MFKGLENGDNVVTITENRSFAGLANAEKFLSPGTKSKSSDRINKLKAPSLSNLAENLIKKENQSSSKEFLANLRVAKVNSQKFPIKKKF